MRKVLWIALLFVAVGLLLTGCDMNSTDRTGGTANRATITSAELEDRVEAKLDSDTGIRDADIDIDANADRNEVTLTGTVDSQAMEARAIEMARSAHAGVVVIDKIDVKAREKSRAEYTEEEARGERERARGTGDTIGDTLDDAWIHMKISAKLIGDADTPARKINVDVVNNAVTLRGTVDTAEQKAEAERIAKDTEGVKSVKNMLKVAGGR